MEEVVYGSASRVLWGCGRGVMPVGLLIARRRGMGKRMMLAMRSKLHSKENRKTNGVTKEGRQKRSL